MLGNMMQLKLTNKDEKHYGASYRGARGALDPLLVYLQSFTDGNTYDQEGNIQINSDECLEAFKKWTDVYLNGYAPEDAINWDSQKWLITLLVDLPEH